MLKILYSLFFICGIFGGSQYIGGVVSYRQFMSVIMLAFCAYNWRYLYRTVNKYIVLYIAFILWWILSSMNEGLLDQSIRLIFSQYLVSLVGYFATVLLYRKSGSISVLIKIIFVTGSLNTIVSLLQFIGNPIGIDIGLYFVDEQAVTIINQLEALSAGGADGSYLFGLFGNAVYNGYFSMLLPFVPLYFYFNGNGVRKFVYLTLSILFLVVLFLIQQRSCFLISSFLLIVILYKTKILNGPRTIACLFAILLLTFSSGLDYIINNDVVQNSRLFSQHEDVRESIYNNAINFIKDHLFFGGIETFRATALFSPHNIFLNAFIYGGLIGGLILIILYFSQLHLAYRLLRNKHKASISIMFIALSLNSLLHNNSILTGDLLVWILWGAVFSESKLNESSIFKRQEYIHEK